MPICYHMHAQTHTDTHTNTHVSPLITHRPLLSHIKCIFAMPSNNNNEKNMSHPFPGPLLYSSLCVSHSQSSITHTHTHTHTKPPT